MSKNESFFYDIITNISQKFSISSIFYLFYNVDITDICKKKSHFFFIFIDDVNVLIKKFTTQTNCETLKIFHENIQQ